MADPTILKRLHLITTADERSWKFDRPVLLLGEWCRRYDRKEAWSKLDSVVSPPFGVSQEERAAHIAIMKRTTPTLLREVAAALNQFHGTTHSARYWETILGHWLLRYSAVIFNRYKTIVQALRGGAVASTTVLHSSGYSLATTSSLAFIWACGDDLWNHVLYARILREVGEIEFEMLPATPHDVCRFESTSEVRDPSASTRKARAATLVSRLLPALAGPSDALLVSTYLPLKSRLQLELSLGQVPQVWRSQPVAGFAADRKLRNALRLETSGYDGFDLILRLLLPELIPTCFLEGYQTLVEQASNLPWPSKPKFIFACNNWDTDELFKAWTAAKVERGTPYIVGQHGNNYGTHAWAGTEYWPERSTPDRFITWGWRDDATRSVPAFNFRVAGQRALRMAKAGNLLLVEATLPHRVELYDVFADHAVYQDEQFRFVQALPAALRDQVSVRLCHEFGRHPWQDDKRWHTHYPELTLDDGRAPLSSLIERSRLVVYSYDSTGILEGLAFNNPLMCFWHGGLSHLLPEAVPAYQLLRDVGIFHETPEGLAAHVANVWDDIAGWWCDKDVQAVRRTFCREYSRTVLNPVKTLRRLLLTTQATEGSLPSGDRSVRGIVSPAPTS